MKNTFFYLWKLFQVGDSFFATHEVGDFNGENGGALSKWQIINGQLTRTESLSLQSVYPAHFVVDVEKNLAITANYGGGAITVVAMDDGSLSHVVQVESKLLLSNLFLECYNS